MRHLSSQPQSVFLFPLSISFDDVITLSLEGKFFGFVSVFNEHAAVKLLYFHFSFNSWFNVFSTPSTDAFLFVMVNSFVLDFDPLKEKTNVTFK